MIELKKIEEICTGLKMINQPNYVKLQSASISAMFQFFLVTMSGLAH